MLMKGVGIPVVLAVAAGIETVLTDGVEALVLIAGVHGV